MAMSRQEYVLLAQRLHWNMPTRVSYKSVNEYKHRFAMWRQICQSLGEQLEHTQQRFDYERWIHCCNTGERNNAE